MEKIDADPSLAARPRRHNRIIAWLSWIYVIEIIAAWIFLRFQGDRSWLGTIAIFSPRWLVLLAAVPLFPLALALNRRCIWIIAIASLAAIFWVMGLSLPWRTLVSPKNPGPVVRVLTCNVHLKAVHSRQLADLIASVHPDIVLLQEWEPPYQSSIFTEGHWNVVAKDGLCLATRFPIESNTEIQYALDAQYVLQTPVGKINLFNVHLASPHPPLFSVLHGLPGGKADLEQNILNRTEESRELDRITQSIFGPVLIAGDFNLCPDSPIFRENFRQFDDAFDAAGFGFGWTYRVKWTSTRIDHILSKGQWTCRGCWLGPDVGSPHRPLIADFSISNAP